MSDNKNEIKKENANELNDSELESATGGIRVEHSDSDNKQARCKRCSVYAVLSPGGYCERCKQIRIEQGLPV